MPWVIRSIFLLEILHRFHVFQNCPDWFVRYTRGMRHDRDPDMRRVGILADDEWRLRKRQQLLKRKEAA